MAIVTITITDININEIDIAINSNTFPKSTLLYTNAQMVAKDILTIFQQMASQINSRATQNSVKELIENHTK